MANFLPSLSPRPPRAMKILVLQDRLRGGTGGSRSCSRGRLPRPGTPPPLLTFRPGGALRGTADGWRCSPLTSAWIGPRRACTGAVPDIILTMGRMANCHADRRGASRARRWSPPSHRPLPLALSPRAALPCRGELPRGARRRGGAPGRGGSAASVIYNALVFPPAAAASRDEALRARLGAGPGTAVLLSVAMCREEPARAGGDRRQPGSTSSWPAGVRHRPERLVASRGLGAQFPGLPQARCTLGRPGPCTPPGASPSPTSSSRPRPGACPASRRS